MEGSPTPSLPLDGTAAYGADAHSTVSKTGHGGRANSTDIKPSFNDQSKDIIPQVNSNRQDLLSHPRAKENRNNLF